MGETFCQFQKINKTIYMFINQYFKQVYTNSRKMKKTYNESRPDR
jgi:hypothetical protein